MSADGPETGVALSARDLGKRSGDRVAWTRSPGFRARP